MTTRYWYVGSPYTDYRGGFDAAAHEACVNAGLLLDAGVRVFSPIAHFHAICCAIGPRPHEFWMAADLPFMASACGLIVLELDGWRDSRGVGMEIEHFARRGVPIVHMTPGTVPAVFADAAPLADPAVRAVR